MECERFTQMWIWESQMWRNKWNVNTKMNVNDITSCSINPNERFPITTFQRKNTSVIIVICSICPPIFFLSEAIVCPLSPSYPWLGGGGNSYNSSWMRKLSHRKLLCPHMWNNKKTIFFNIPSCKLGKNVNLFHLKMNLF